jgi:hypothetical protein
MGRGDLITGEITERHPMGYHNLKGIPHFFSFFFSIVDALNEQPSSRASEPAR